MVLAVFAYLAVCWTSVHHVTVTLSVHTVIGPALHQFNKHDLCCAKPGCFYRPKAMACYRTVLTSMLVLMAGVEPNPGPELTFGLLNARSIVTKGQLIHDLIMSEMLDIV